VVVRQVNQFKVVLELQELLILEVVGVELVILELVELEAQV
jgi:hypothetical protein